MLLCKFQYANHAHSVNLKPLEIFPGNLVHILSIIRRCAENKYRNSSYRLYVIMPLYRFQYGTRVRSIKLKSYTCRYFLKFWYREISDDNYNSTTVFTKLCPFVMLFMEILSAPLLETVNQVFIFFGTNIKHYQTICSEQEPLFSPSFLKDKLLCKFQYIQ